MLSIWGIYLLPLLVSARSSDGSDIFNRPDFMTLNQCPVRGGYKEVSVEEAFQDYRLVPDIIDVAPKDKLDVVYPLAIVNLGNYLPPSVFTHPPYISYSKIQGDKLYTLMFISPDILSAVFPLQRSFVYRLAMNYPGDFSFAPDIVAPFLTPNPYPNAGETRFVHLVFEQPGEIDVTQPDIARIGVYRNSFNVTEFASKYNLGDAVAGNFFISEATAYTSTHCNCH